MNVNDGNYRITFEGSADVVMLFSDTSRTSYHRERGDSWSLYTLFHTRVHYCRVGEPLILSAQSYEGASMPNGIVKEIETSYHPVFAPDAPQIFGPAGTSGSPLTDEELDELMKGTN